MKRGGLLEAITDLSQERGLEPEAVIEALEDAILAAAYRKYSDYRNIEASFNRRTGEIELFYYRVVTDTITDPHNQILLDEVRQIDPQAECGDEVEYEIDVADFRNVIAQTARQSLFQKIREVERESIVEKFSDKKGEIIHGKVARIDRRRVVIVLNNNAEAALDQEEQLPFEKFEPGEHLRALLLDIKPDRRGPQLVASRTHPAFLMKLFEMEVPEVFEGVIEIISASREPGKRAKVSVKTNDPDVDPVGACVGVRGARVQAIVSELCGERIDIVEWSEVPERYIANALAPAKIIDIEIAENKRDVNVFVEPDQLSLAIGKQGQNVRLASQLTRYKINVNALAPADKTKLDEAAEDASSEEIQEVNEAVVSEQEESLKEENESVVIEKDDSVEVF